MKTQEERREEVQDLKDVKKALPFQTELGDDTHQAIDAQIDVLAHDLSREDILDKYAGYSQSAALCALHWLEDGQLDLADDWLDLYEKRPSWMALRFYVAPLRPPSGGWPAPVNRRRKAYNGEKIL